MFALLNNPNMPPKIPTSFIPQKPAPLGHNKVSGGLFYVLGVIIFVITLALSVGVFVYKKILVSKIGNMETELSTAKAALQPELIAELSRSNARFESAKSLIASHTLLSSFFNLLESLTLKSVRFTNFSYDISEARKVSVSMRGSATSFSTVALQAKVFSEDSNFINPQFSNLDLDKDGNVTFTFKSDIDQKLVSYKTYIDSLVMPATPAPTDVSTTTPESNVDNANSQPSS